MRLGRGRILACCARIIAGLAFAVLVVHMSGPEIRSFSTLAVAETNKQPVASAARIAGDARKTRFILDLSEAVGFSVYVLPDPFRVVIDTREIDFRLPPAIGKQGRGLVSEYRYGRYAAGKSRLVLDTNAPVLIEKSFMLEPENDQPARLVVDLIRTDAVTFAKIRERIGHELERRSGAEQVDSAGSPEEDGDPAASEPDGLVEVLADAEMPVAPPAVEYRTLAGDGDTPAPRARPRVADTQQPAGEQEALASLDGGQADADSVEDLPRPRARPETARRPSPRPGPEARPVIVIDPGHGGVDPGTVSRNGVREKDIVLAFSKVLRDQLEATGRYEIHLTRDDDRFLALRNRVDIARGHGADLFVSVHADSLSRGTARGATVYTLSERASDREAAALAAKENAADIVGGVDVGQDNREVAGILLDLVQRETKNHSIFFAKRLITEMEQVTLMRTRPHRYAGFHVLRAPDIPSILVELGYLSTPADEKLLTSPQWRSKVASSMVQAIHGFFGTSRVALGN